MEEDRPYQKKKRKKPFRFSVRFNVALKIQKFKLSCDSSSWLTKSTIYLWMESPNQMHLFEAHFLRVHLGSSWSCDLVKQAVSKPELFGLQPNQTKAPFQKMILFQKILFFITNAVRKSDFLHKKKCNGLPSTFFFFFLHWQCTEN